MAAQPLAYSAAAADAARFARWIHSRQYPADCGTTVGAFPEQSYFWGLGLGAQMVALKFGLLNALLHNQVYHFPTSHYTNPLRCPSRSFDCYFERASHCSKTTHRRVATSRIYWCFDTPARRLTELAGLSAIHPKEWYQAQLAAFLFRPNAELRAFRSKLLATLERSDPYSNASRAIAAASVVQRKKKGPKAGGGKKGGKKGGALKYGGVAGLGRRLARRSVAAEAREGGRRLEAAAPEPRPAGVAGGGARALNGTCVAVHIRRTDKFKTNRREDHMQMKGFPDYAQLFKSWAYWRATAPPAALTLLLGSEDKATFAQFPPLVAPTVAYWIPSSYFVMDSTPGKKFESIRQGNSRLGELYALMEARAKELGLAPEQLRARREADAEAARLLTDEGMILVAQILMMGECGAMIGSYASNVAVLVHDLMYAERASSHEQFHALDINGRAYCGCGASFCMTLERKAVRDPTKSIKQIVAGFKS